MPCHLACPRTPQPCRRRLLFAATRLALTSLVVTSLALTRQAFATEDRFTIDRINLNEENFLDIKAHRFRKSLEYQWYDNNSAWRISGASLDGDLTYIQNELKLQSELSDTLNVRLETQQEIFYTSRPQPLPTAEVEIYPAGGNVGFSLLGTPAYEKREADMGGALILGRRPWDFLRLEYREIDALYNQKNGFDSSYYDKQPKSFRLQGAWNLASKLKLVFDLRHQLQGIFYDPDQQRRFSQRESGYQLMFDYLLQHDRLVGFSLSGFDIDKNISNTSNSRADSDVQSSRYLSLDIYWVSGLNRELEWRLGSQYDAISNRLRLDSSPADSVDYGMKTLQFYATAWHRFSEHLAWDLGLYVGDVEERHDYLQKADEVSRSIEAKLRLGLVYAASDGRSNLQFNLSLNADDPIRDPGDGGGISFQTSF